MLRIYLPFVFGLLMTACANNPTQEHAQQLKVDPQTLEQAKKIAGYECRAIKQTGSRIGKKVCTTRAQREAAKKRSKMFVEDYRDNNVAVPKVDGQ